GRRPERHVGGRGAAAVDDEARGEQPAEQQEDRKSSAHALGAPEVSSSAETCIGASPWPFPSTGVVDATGRRRGRRHGVDVRHRKSRRIVRIQRTPWPTIAAVRVQGVSKESDAGPAASTLYVLETSSWLVRGTLLPPTLRCHASFGASATRNAPTP